jgi:hypothetical protein
MQIHRIIVGWVSIALGCRAQLFVRGKLVRLFTVFVSNIEARQPRAAVDRRCSSDTRPSQLKEHSTLKFYCRGTNNRSDLARHAPSSRAATSYRLCEAKHGSRAQSIPGFREPVTVAALSKALIIFARSGARIVG